MAAPTMTRGSLPPPPQLRLLCVGASPLQASLTAAALACRNEVGRVDWTAELSQALHRAADADVVVFQPAPPVDGGLTWVRAISDAHPEVLLIVSGVPADEALVVAYVEAGAMGCITEGQDVAHLVEAVQTVHRRGGYLTPALISSLVHRLATLQQAQIDPEAAARRLETLSPRENEVLALMTQGCSNGVIADRLRLGVGTVKNHVHNILQKLHVSGRWEAAACLEIAGRHGFAPSWPLAWGLWPADGCEPLDVPAQAASPFPGGDPADAWREC